MKTTALIMAGGRGERFWPASRKRYPKQFLSFTPDGKSMIQKTVERILPLAALQDVFIVTNEAYKGIVLEQLPGLPEENILCEPVGRNTAPCIGLGAVHIAAKYGLGAGISGKNPVFGNAHDGTGTDAPCKTENPEDALMLVLPSDSLINDTESYLDTVRRAMKVAEEKDAIVTLGIEPKYPETGYGYIKYRQDSEVHGCSLVERFVEKPDLETAKEYLKNGGYLWNAGNFIFRVSTILDKLSLYQPAIYENLQRIRAAIGTPTYDEALKAGFADMPSISIDYAVLEKSDCIYTARSAFDWDDVGSWLALSRTFGEDSEGNTFKGDIISFDTKNCIVKSTNRLVALVGVEDLVVVETPDAVLVCDKSKTAEIKELLAKMKALDRPEL